jgi:hypothetical protein
MIPNRAELEKAEPSMPPGLDDRAEDLWEPLLAVADLAGGEWPRRGRQAAQVLAAERAETDHDLSEGIRLLSDISDLFSGQHRSFIPSRELVAGLRGLDESPWPEMSLTAKGLADRLRKFGIRSGHNTARTMRGYQLADFDGAFSAYLSVQPVQASETDSDLPGRMDE